MSTPQIEDIIENFEFLDDWEDRYRYVIELGKTLEPLPDEDHREELKVEGCVSQVWLRCDKIDGKLHYLGDSDAHIVSGLVAIALAAHNDKLPHEVLEVDMPAIIAQLGLQEHLTPQRSNGLKAMIFRIRAYAEEAS